MTPAEELRVAATKIRSLAAAIEAPDLPDQTWHTEACASEERGDCPCIVTQGTCNTEGPFVQPLFYVADAETPECAAYIAAMGPPVALAVAEWLEETATAHDAAVVAARQVWGTEAEEAQEWLTTGLGRVAPQALAVARAVLGSSDG